VKHYHTGKALAIAAGIASTGGALAILLHEPITGAAPWRLDHVLTPLAVALTVAAGHLVGTALYQRAWASAAGFALFFIVGTGLTLYSSVGSQRSAAVSREVAVRNGNDAVQDLEADVKRLAGKLEAHQLQLARFAGVRSRAEIKADLDAVVGLGEGKVPFAVWKRTTGCQDATADARIKACAPVLRLRAENGQAGARDLLRSELATIEAQLAKARAELRATGGERVAPSKARPFAEVVSVLFGFDKAHVELVAAVLEAPAFAMLFELGAIVAFGFGFSHTRPATVAAPTGGPGTRRRLPATVAEPLPANVVRFAGNRSTEPDIIGAIRAAGGEATVSELATLMGVSRGEASKRWREAGNRVRAQRHGRELRVSLARASSSNKSEAPILTAAEISAAGGRSSFIGKKAPVAVVVASDAAPPFSLG
jgi:hypothetical protein